MAAQVLGQRFHVAARKTGCFIDQVPGNSRKSTFSTESTHSRHSSANGLRGQALPMSNKGAADATQRLVLKGSLHVERFICRRSLQT
jgi:hypothetical protein